VQDGRIHIELINAPFLNAGGTQAKYRGIEHAITKGWLWRHESGVYVRFKVNPNWHGLIRFFPSKILKSPNRKRFSTKTKNRSGSALSLLGR